MREPKRKGGAVPQHHRALPPNADVVVIGAGFGGIAAGVRLMQAGIDSFVILEQSDGIGGTWWHNTYPGCEVDIGSHLYSYSFAPYDWSRTHAPQPELHRYLEGVVSTFNIKEHIFLRSKVIAATWDESDHRYRVELENAPAISARVVISAVGLFGVPRFPEWPGLNRFRGPVFHTAQWEHKCDLRGSRVAVVGTGSSASQVVPAIAPIVGKLYLFQREPGWVIPKGERDFTAKERSRFRDPRASRWYRYKMFLGFERTKENIFPGSRSNRDAQAGCEEYIGKVFEGRPDLRAAVTPSYPFFGKRPIFNSRFYPALLRDNVELVPAEVVSATETGIVDAFGIEREVDVIVLATGFQPSNFLASFELRGRGGRTIQEVWSGEPRAFLGMTVAGFPNFYMLYGPNTNSTPSAVFFLECQANYAVRDVKRMLGSDITELEVRAGLVDRYNEWLQSRLTRTAFQLARNYYKVSSGRIVTQFPYGGLVYWLLTRTLRTTSATVRRAGDPERTRSTGQLNATLSNAFFAVVRRVAEALSASMSLIPSMSGGASGYDAFHSKSSKSLGSPTSPYAPQGPERTRGD
jgi:cation diffusion facilitator CzcD-associated flavoprotein CzcO